MVNEHLHHGTGKPCKCTFQKHLEWEWDDEHVGSLNEDRRENGLATEEDRAVRADSA
jgi:hypothetical protein